MDEDSELGASVVRNLDVVESAYRHLAKVDERLLGVSMFYMREIADELGWHLVGMDTNAAHYGFKDHKFCPTAWVNEEHPEETKIFFAVESVEPEGGDLSWATCFTAALGDEAGTVIKFELPLPRRTKKNFLSRNDVAIDISTLGCEIDDNVLIRFVINREALAMAFGNDDGEDINDGFRVAFAPLGAAMRSLAMQYHQWDAVRMKALAALEE